MKKAIISILVVVGIAGIIALVTYKPTDSSSTDTTLSSTSSTSSGTSSSTGSSTATGTYKSGTYTGSVSENEYGPVRVSVTIANNKITSVSMLQTPNDHQRSQEINSYATPILIKEAISSQTADVDAVSGATATSMSFTESLQSALDQAKS